MTNYTSLSACAAHGSNVATSFKQQGGNPMDAMKGSSDGWVGPNASFSQKMAYEWGALKVVFEGDENTIALCNRRIEDLKQST